MDFVEKNAKTIDEAVELALKELGIIREEAEISVIEEGSKGFLGFGAKDAVVRVKPLYNPVKIADEFLKTVCSAMGLSIENEIKVDGRVMTIEIKGEGMGMLIGKRGHTLDSLQYLVGLVVNKGKAPYMNIMLDTENYRQRRRETLETLAVNLGKKVKATKKKVILEPMTAYERSIIHSALQNDDMVTTHSQGEEPFRKVVISLK